MSDFVTLSCPSCGGKLNVQKNSLTYICDYCGMEHKLREEDIESFGRCPRCHRNDRVEKISAIVNKQDPLAAKFPSPDTINIDRFLLRPDLATAQILNSLQNSQFQENAYQKKGRICFFGAAVLLAMLLSISLARHYSSFLNALFFLSILSSLVLAIFGVLNTIKGDRKQRESEIEAHNTIPSLEKELLTQRREYNNQRSILKRELKSRYDQMYYCHRDDLLFIPGKSGYASCNDYENFLTQGIKTNKNA